MESIHVLYVLIPLTVAIIGAIIGLYACMIKYMKDANDQIAKVYVTVNSHIQNHKLHLEGDTLVNIKVCEEVQKRNDLMFQTLMKGQEEIKNTLNSLDSKLEFSLQNEVVSLKAAAERKGQ